VTKEKKKKKKKKKVFVSQMLKKYACRILIQDG